MIRPVVLDDSMLRRSIAVCWRAVTWYWRDDGDMHAANCYSHGNCSQKFISWNWANRWQTEVCKRHKTETNIAHGFAWEVCSYHVLYMAVMPYWVVNRAWVMLFGGDVECARKICTMSFDLCHVYCCYALCTRQTCSLQIDLYWKWGPPTKINSFFSRKRVCVSVVQHFFRRSFSSFCLTLSSHLFRSLCAPTMCSVFLFFFANYFMQIRVNYLSVIFRTGSFARAWIAPATTITRTMAPRQFLNAIDTWLPELQHRTKVASHWMCVRYLPGTMYATLVPSK